MSLKEQNFSSKKYRLPLIGLMVLLVILFVCDLFSGSVSIPLKEVFSVLSGHTSSNDAWQIIIMNFRLPKAITAMIVGAGLAVCGLQMQTLFRNPLAGPYVLGVSSGASLGVALAMLGGGYLSAGLVQQFWWSKMSIVGAAGLGSALVLLLVLTVSRRINDNMTLLILGIMFGHITGALQGVLQYFSAAERLQGFVIWSLGNFSNVVWSDMNILLPGVFIGLLISFILSKPLNALLLGENYASSMGVKVKRTRIWVIVSTGLLAGCITAFCGPIAFLGMAVPHLARSLFITSDHKILIPACILTGAALALFCDIIAQLPGASQVLPVNAVTSLVGAPVVIWVILRKKGVRA